ncbi:rod shape-determining protein MreC [Sneathiella chinensis]|uniref:Cell shape-determining protein MreC n=1 Tax=Sneathiella chinensis TaxID=349750 RepID=A0ABQ5U5G5_9PROT|nr:rod shape-determining protein MreC [Sneathiella chinensis]GLQ06430.1 cell shape-determining protein MreC [Sneathiella chinensis]
MSLRQGTASKIAFPLKNIIQRFAFLSLIVLSIALLVLGKADLVLMERVRTISVDALSPVLGTLSQPVNAINKGIERVRELASLIEENERLRRENERLQKWQAASLALDKENENFRRLLNALSDPLVLPITARVIGDSGGPFVRTLLLNAGSRDGIRVGQAVVGPHGLVGRIAETGRQSSRVLLLTDLNSRVPVLLQNSRHKGILVGDNSISPKLEYLQTNAQVSAGDRVVTSGDGGMLPSGWPIGTVSSVTEGQVRVQAFADWARLEFVSVLRYDLPGLTDQGTNPGDLGESRLGESRFGN